MKQYPFYNRKSELGELKSLFEENILGEKSTLCVLIKGRKGIGKTRLVNEFVNLITTDLEIISRIPQFTLENNLIEHTCTVESGPFDPFFKVANKIRSKEKFLRVLISAFRVLLAIVNVNEVLRSLEDLADSIKREESSENLLKKEIKTFRKYVSFVKRTSRKSPLIIYIRQSQYIDKFSLKLIRALSDKTDPMWGMIILEEDTSDMSEEIYSFINKLINEKRLTVLNVTALNKSFPAALISSRYGASIINPEENDVLFAISEGCPGRLIDFIEGRCLPEGWIYESGGKYLKVEDFLEKIKPAEQKLVELIISLYEDNELSDSEYKLIQRMSKLWGVGSEPVKRTTTMIVDVMDSGFKILINLGPGIVSRDSFIVSDTSNNRFILEYLPVKSERGLSLKHRDVVHTNLLEAREIKSTDKGLIILWDYFENKKTREALIEKRELKTSSVLQKYKRIAAVLAKLHNSGIVHGFLRPETIIEAADDKILLAAFNDQIFNDQQVIELLDTPDSIFYQPPEQLISNVLSPQGDIFCFGVLFYRDLTNRLPFYGNTKIKILESIKNNQIALDIEFSGSKTIADLRGIIEKCLKYDPAERYGDASELVADLDRIVVTQKEIRPNAKGENVIKSNPKTKPIKFIKYVAALIAIAGLIVAAVLYVGPKKTIQPAIVLNVSQSSSKSDASPIDNHLLSYLIYYDLLQGSNLLVTNPEDFYKVYSDKHLPSKSVEVVLHTDDFRYHIDVTVNNRIKGIKRNARFEAHHYRNILTTDMFLITEFILDSNRTNNYVLTIDWEAFLYFYKGEDAWNRIDKNLAKRYFENALIRDTSFVLAKLRLAEVLFFEGNDQEARAMSDIVMVNSAKLSKVDSIRAIALSNRLYGRMFDAVGNYQALINRMPDRKDLYYELAETYFQLRDIQNARICYLQCLRLDPIFLPAINHLAYCYSHLGDHETALMYFGDYVRLDSSANAFDSYGDGLMAAGMLDEAKLAKKRGLALDPALDYMYLSLGYIYLRMGLVDSALISFKTHLSKQSTAQTQAFSLGNIAYSHFVGGDLSEAYRYCMLSKSLFDVDDVVAGNHMVNWLYARIALQNGNRQEARKVYHSMDSLVKANNISHQNYNELLKYYKHLEALIYPENLTLISNYFDFELAEKVKDWSSAFDLAYFNTELGINFFKSHDTISAMKRFEKALDYNPNYLPAHYWLSDIYGYRGEVEAAQAQRDAFEKYYQGNSDKILFH
jgi:tetratricopeptide (TPR) repeat protein/serine/threonine protein kinase